MPLAPDKDNAWKRLKVQPYRETAQVNLKPTRPRNRS